MFKNKIQKIKEKKKQEKEYIEKNNQAYEKSCKINREHIEHQQNETTKNLICPLCKNTKFFTGIQLAYTNYKLTP